MAYDGSGDLQRSPICNVVLCNPKPLLYDVSDHEGKSKYGAEQHKQKLDALKLELEQLNSDFKLLSLHTDNENTMVALRREMKRDHGVPGPGCAAHGAQLVLGMSLHIVNANRV